MAHRGAPKAIHCPLCNGAYFRKSLPIHYAQCQAKWIQTHANCKYCDREIHIDDLRVHERRCSKEWKIEKKVKKQRPSTARQKSKSKAMTKLDVALATTTDPRIACKYCGRRFNPNRIDKHESICSSVTPKNRSHRSPINRDEESSDDKVSASKKRSMSVIEPKPKERRRSTKKDRSRSFSAKQKSHFDFKDKEVNHAKRKAATKGGINASKLTRINKSSNEPLKSRKEEMMIHFEALSDKLQMQILELTKSFHEMM